MPEIAIQPFGQADIPAAAHLLAARHAANRRRLPFLSARLEEPAVCEAEIAALFRRKRAGGAVAKRNREVAGFLFGEQMLFAPHQHPYQYIHPHSIEMPVQGHAVAPGEDQQTIYRALYGFLAERWVGDGFFAHRLYIVPGDAELQEAWVALGFGRHTTCATRDTAAPVTVRPPAGVEIHQAGREDLDVVLSLAHTLGLHHVNAPMFWPMLQTVEPANHDFHARALDAGVEPYFVAYREGRPVGMQTFLRPGFTPPTIDHETDVYLYEGVVEPDVRSGGVGRALLAHAMAWARGLGYRTCTLHFASNNPSGAPFWLGQGFVPVEHSMDRIIDGRIAWANGRA